MKRVVRASLHGSVVDAIGKSILAGELPSGSPLPIEASLCSTLGVSRTALREALRVLAAKGLVKARPKVGTLVQPLEVWNFLDADVLAWRFQGADAEQMVAELYELRALIEPTAASLAASRATSADVAKMRRAFHAMEGAGDDGQRIIDPDVRFHTAIIRASGNMLFASLAHVIGAALAMIFQIVSTTPRGQRHSMPGHRKVLSAIEEGDSAGARLAMQKLIEDSQEDVRLVRGSLSRTRVTSRGPVTGPRKRSLMRKGAA